MLSRFLNHSFAYALITAAGVLAASQNASGQLTILSEGNAEQKWQETQIATLEEQLNDSSIRGELREELKAQHKWLNTWASAPLTDESFWANSKPSARLTEPTIDPAGTAAKLREKLLGPDARPTIADTKQLEGMLARYPNDIGVRQLHLHWLDQKQYRKTYPDEIAEAALNLLGLMDALTPEAITAAGIDSSDLRNARAYCLYRRGRALAYRELADVTVKKPIENPQAHEAALLGAYSQLTALVGEGRPEFILLEIRMLRRDHWYGRALNLLESHGAVIKKQWFLKKRRDLLRELGWQKPAKTAAELYAKEFPAAAESEEDDT